MHSTQGGQGGMISHGAVLLAVCEGGTDAVGRAAGGVGGGQSMRRIWTILQHDGPHRLGLWAKLCVHRQASSRSTSFGRL